MARRLLAPLACVALVATAAPMSALSATPPYLDVRIAKTARWIRAAGIFEPARPNRTINVRLARDTGNGFEPVGRRNVPLNGNQDTDGDGRAESVFGATFTRPKTGTCRVVAIFRRQDRPPVRDEDVFACAIPAFGTGTATITGDHDPVSVDLLVAENDQQRAYGLSFRERLAADRGMVFLFDGDTNVRFWMKDTLIPLSIAFFDAQGFIVDIQHMDPCYEGDECPTYGPSVPYRGALEVNRGAFDDWQVGVGDRIDIAR